MGETGQCSGVAPMSLLVKIKSIWRPCKAPRFGGFGRPCRPQRPVLGGAGKVWPWEARGRP